MNLETLRAFFGWCTVIDGVLLILSFLAYTLAGDRIYRLHRRWYPISREAFGLAMYGFIGGMKILVLVGNLVPYLALTLLRPAGG